MIQLPAALRIDLRDTSAGMLQRVNQFAREVLDALVGLRDRHAIIAMDWLGGQTNVAFGAGPAPVLGVLPCKTTNQTTGAAVALPGITWRQEGSAVIVEALSGLSAGVSYRVHFLLVRG